MRRLHRYAGISAGVILIYLVATGLPLQFTDTLNLGSRYVTSPVILDYYDLAAPETVRFDSGVAQVGERLFWQSREIAEAERLIGAVTVQDLIAVGTDRALLVFDPMNPGSIERINFTGGLLAIALTDRGVLLKTPDGIVQLDAQLLNAQPVPVDASAVAWRQPSMLPTAQAAPYRVAYRNSLLSLERLLQDLHSGRTFGSAGVWIINLATLLLIGLAVTGYWLWWRSRPR